MNNTIVYDEEILRFMAKMKYYNFCKEMDYYCPYNISQREKDVFEMEFDGNQDTYRLYKNKASAIAVRKWRLKLRIDYMIKNFKCMFVTLTISDEYISRNISYLRQYVCKFLKKMNCFYVGNIDYGSINERMHFHFVVASDDIDFIKNNYKLGFSDIRIITSNNAYRLSNYLDKLTLHAIKQETKNRYQIISSRGDFAFTDILNNYRLMNYKESDFDIWN